MKKTKADFLNWVNPKTGERFHAGVAFYDDSRGEHRLILDGPRTVFCLKPFGSEGDRILFRVYANVLIQNSYSHQVEMGHGYSDSTLRGQICMTIGRYEPMKLMLTPREVSHD